MGKVKVLIVEDEVVVAMDMQDMLLDLGYEVLDTAINFDEARRILETNKPDLVLCDINLGESKDGIDLAEIIRKKDIPFIFSTSYSDKNTVQRAVATKPNGYLLKPFEKDELYTSIETALANYNGSPIANEVGVMVADSLFIKVDRLFVKVKFVDILWLQADHNYIKIFSTNGRYMVRMSFKELLTKLPSERFFRTHKSYYVNVDKLEAVNSTYVLINEQEIPLSRNYKDDLLNRLNRVL